MLSANPFFSLHGLYRVIFGVRWTQCHRSNNISNISVSIYILILSIQNDFNRCSKVMLPNISITQFTHRHFLFASWASNMCLQGSAHHWKGKAVKTNSSSLLRILITSRQPAVANSSIIHSISNHRQLDGLFKVCSGQWQRKHRRYFSKWLLRLILGNLGVSIALICTMYQGSTSINKRAFRYRDANHNEKTVLRSSYLHNGNPTTVKRHLLLKRKPAEYLMMFR